MDFSLIKFDDRGLVPAIAQNVSGGAVLMLGFADREALEAFERTGFAHFHSRSRDKLWMKGETSGNRLAVAEIRLDCDGDTILYLCRPEGPTCHTGDPTCFTRTLSGSATSVGPEILAEVETVLLARKKAGPAADPGSYTAKLLSGDTAKIRGKVSEEALECVLASEKNDPVNLADEVADLWFHTLVLLVKHGLSLSDVAGSLAKRRGVRRQ